MIRLCALLDLGDNICQRKKNCFSTEGFGTSASDDISVCLCVYLLTSVCLFLAALCDMHPMRALFLIPRNPPPKLKSKKWSGCLFCLLLYFFFASVIYCVYMNAIFPLSFYIKSSPPD